MSSRTFDLESSVAPGQEGSTRGLEVTEEAVVTMVRFRVDGESGDWRRERKRALGRESMGDGRERGERIRRSSFEVATLVMQGEGY